MRKLLLGTTALAAAATLSANALADVAVSGYYEWRYESRSSNVTATDGTQFASDSEIKFVFSNKLIFSRAEINLNLFWRRKGC